MTINQAAWSTLIAVLILSTVFCLFAYVFLRNSIRKANSPSSGTAFEVTPSPSQEELPFSHAELEEKLREAIEDLLEKKLYSTYELQSDGVMPSSSAVLGVLKLEAYARKCAPIMIVGVNRGGWLLSTYLAHRLGIERSNILRYDSGDDEIKDKHIPSISAKDKILLIDDISRTGSSISKGIQCIKENFASSELSTAVLVVCDDTESNEQIDFKAYHANTKDIQLPWSSEERKQEARRRLANSGIGLDITHFTSEGNTDQEGISVADADADVVRSILGDIPKIINDLPKEFLRREAA
jgi:hypoxanthine phosphoribosyltransferase